MHLELKDQGTTAPPTTPSANNQVTLTRYHVEYTRADGRNTQGVDVPFAFDGAITGDDSRVRPVERCASSSCAAHAKQESPLVQLVSNSAEHHHDDCERHVLRDRPGRQRHIGDRFDHDRFRQLC